MYRYGFNGQEKDDEIKGTGNTYGATFWEFDSRLGRRWNIDPKPTVGLSVYSTFANNPIMYIDPLGDTTINGQKYEPNTPERSTFLQEVVLTSISKVAKKPMTADYTKAFTEQIKKSSVRRMLTGLSTIGNELFESRFDPYKILRLKEAEKQAIFTQSANKTIAILFSEFVEGKGAQRRDFDQNAPITQEIANSYTTSLFLDYFYPLYKSGLFNDGAERLHTVFTSPDNAGSIKNSIKAHAQGLWNQSALFTGSLDYYFRVSGNRLFLRVHNEFSISSGITRNKSDDLRRVPGHDSPLGNTEQYFNFSLNLDQLKRQ